MSVNGLDIPKRQIELFCRENVIRRLAFFGSVLRQDFGADSDIDVLVEFGEGVRIGLDFVRIQDDLTAILGQPVDLHTPASLSRYSRRQVIDEAEVVYEQTG